MFLAVASGPQLQDILPHRPSVPPVRRLPAQRIEGLDLLVIDETVGWIRARTTQGHRPSDYDWISLLEQANPPARPRIVLVIEPSQVLARESGAVSSGTRKRMRTQGYQSQVWFLSAQDYGGALVQDRSVSVFTLGRDLPPTPQVQGLPAHPMQNLLLPVGIPPQAWYRGRDISPIEPPKASPSGLLVVGTTQHEPVYSPQGPMPDSARCLVDTEQGVRRVTFEELGRAKGFPKEWGPIDGVPKGDLHGATSIHIWAALGESLFPWLTSRRDTTESAPLPAPPPSPPSDIRALLLLVASRKQLREADSWCEAVESKLKDIDILTADALLDSLPTVNRRLRRKGHSEFHQATLDWFRVVDLGSPER